MHNEAEVIFPSLDMDNYRRTFCSCQPTRCHSVVGRVPVLEINVSSQKNFIEPTII